MTRAERLRAAAEAPRLADHVRVSRDGMVRPRQDKSLFGDYPAFVVPGQQWMFVLGFRHFDAPTREAAIRAGLLALAEREEARGC